MKNAFSLIELVVAVAVLALLAALAAPPLLGAIERGRVARVLADLQTAEVALEAYRAYFFAKLARPDACLARHGKGFKGQARGAAYGGLHRYVKVDRWKPIRVADHPYDLELCDLCVRECPIKDAIVLEPMSSDPKDKRRTPVVKQACVGCGMCEMICPTEPAAIVVEERLTWEVAAKGARA